MKFVLKQSSVLELTIAEDKELHSQMDLRKKENLKTSFRILGILYLKAWLLRTQVSLPGTINFSVLISTRLWLSLYVSVNLFFFLLISKVSHSSSLSISVMLAVRLNFWMQKHAAFLWTLSSVISNIINQERLFINFIDTDLLLT